MSDSSHKQSVSVSTPYTTFREDGQPVSLAVVEAVAAVTNRPVLPDDLTIEDSETTPLPPLHEVIDPDALNTICQSDADNVETVKTVVFTYSGYEVTVKSNGQTTVTER